MGLNCESGRPTPPCQTHFEESETSPGYDKVFDKTSPGSQVMDVVNPVDLAVRVQDIERRIGRPVQ
jgi:hypothetical protein